MKKYAKSLCISCMYSNHKKRNLEFQVFSKFTSFTAGKIIKILLLLKNVVLKSVEYTNLNFFKWEKRDLKISIGFSFKGTFSQNFHSCFRELIITNQSSAIRILHLYKSKLLKWIFSFIRVSVAFEKF